MNIGKRETGNGNRYKMYRVKNRKIVSGYPETNHRNLDLVSQARIVVNGKTILRKLQTASRKHEPGSTKIVDGPNDR